MASIAILGGGAWGTALAASLTVNGHTVMLWARRRQTCDAINARNENVQYLPGITLPAALCASPDMAYVCAGADLIVLAVPSCYLAEVAALMNTTPRFQRLRTAAVGQEYPLIGILTKGFIPDQEGMPHLITDALGALLPSGAHGQLVYISGPSHAQEVAQGKVTGLIAASQNPMAAIRVRELLRSKRVQVYSSLDVVGVQVCAAVKNVIAIAFGLLDAMAEHSEAFGDNTESMLLAAGLNEIQTIGKQLGSTHPETFTSLAGIGDLDVTCRSAYGRNRRFGRDIVHKGILDSFSGIQDLVSRLPEIGYLAEGVVACMHVQRLAERDRLKVPICAGLYAILNREKGADTFMQEILGW